MAKPPPSVVLKLHKPSTAQVSLTHQQDLANIGAQYDAAVRSGRIPGAPSDIGGGLSNMATAGVASPTKTNKQGFVTSPLGSLGDLSKTPDPHRKVMVKVHPTGHIEVVHAPHVTPPAVAATAALGSAPHATGGPPAPNIQGTPPKSPKKRATTATATPTTTAAPALTDQQLVQNILSQMYSPLVDQTKGVFKDRQSGINDYTKILADLMGSYGDKAGEAYGQASAAQAAVDSALGAALGGNASSAQTDLAGKLGGLGNTDYASKLTGDLGTAYKGGQGVQAATGANTLGSLLAEGAHAKDYGAKLPGTAGLFGLQATKGLSKELTTALGNLQTQEATQIPTLLQNVSTQKAQAAQLAFENKLAGFKAKNDKVALDNQTAKTISDIYGIAPDGTPSVAGRRVAAQELTAKKKQGGMTASQKTSLLTKADKRADDFYYGTAQRYYQGQPVAGSGLPPVEYPQALQRLVAMGLTVVQAKKELDSRYQPGEGGRPAFTPKQESINRSLFPDPFAGLTTGH